MSKAEAASFSTKTESETVQVILHSRSNDEILTSSKEITIASNEACQSNENTNDANPTVSTNYLFIYINFYENFNFD
jgi:hypothetical protein